MQVQAIEEAPSLPLGQYFQATAYRRSHQRRAEGHAAVLEPEEDRLTPATDREMMHAPT